MAYFSQEDKAKVSPAIKAILKKYGVKGSIAVRNHSTLVVNIKQGSLDFLGAYSKIRENHARQRGSVVDTSQTTYIQVNRYYTEEWHRDIGETKIADFFKELIAAMMGADWFDKSDIQTDYFHTAYYMDINVGHWDQPYQLVK